MSRRSPMFALALSLATAALAFGASGCASETDSQDENAADQDQAQTSSLLKVGTYKLSGAPTAWTIKQLVLKSGGAYTVVMYPGRAFPIADVKTTNGKYTTAGNTLRINFSSGNLFEKWEVTKSGSKLHFHDLEESSEFDMTYEGASTNEPDPEPVQGRDPGLPTPVAGGIDIRCHSGAGDIFANLSLAPSGVGKMKLSSTTSLRLSRVENVTLHKDPDASGSSGWLHVVGDGNSTDDAQYQFDIPTSFLRNGGKDKAISMAFSHDSEHFMFDSWGMVCSTH